MADNKMSHCYVHVPFCKDICNYCDFFKCRYHEGVAQKWLISLQAEIVQKLSNTELNTLYIGGGTPSVLSLKIWTTLMQSLQPYLNKDTQFCMEANVDSFDKDKITSLQKHHINRISLGVQSFQPALLTLMNRKHDATQTVYVINALKNIGIHNISIDLIYGLPDQTIDQWLQDLKMAVACKIQHISIYALSIEKNTNFYKNNLQPIDDALEGEMYETAIKFLQDHGFEQYEVSNFCKKGFQSKHNLCYWTYQDFIGIGCGASGKHAHKRYDNTRNLQTYIESGPSPTWIHLSKEEEVFEYIMMNLRQIDGISIIDFQIRFQINLFDHFSKVIQQQINKDMLIKTNTHLLTTSKGRLFLNDVLLAFM